MKPKNYGKDISSVNTPVRFHLPDGSTQQFKNSQEAQAWFNENYSNGYSMTEYIPTQGDSIHPIELEEITVTAPGKPKSTSTRKGVDMFIGANYSPSFNRASARLGMNPLNWPKHIPSSYWDSGTHRAIHEGSNIAAGIASSPFVAYVAAEYALPWLAKNVAPYLSARGWLGATQAAGNTPAWLTPTSATAIDAALAGSATGASINDMRENGPTVGNVLGTSLGLGGLAFEAVPTVMEGYTAARNAVRPAIVGMKMRTMPLGEVETPTLIPQMRYRLGDVEINDPNLNYRQGAKGTAQETPINWNQAVTAVQNRSFVEAYNSWNRFGYPNVPRGIISNTPKLEAFVRGQLNRHNTFSRGVQKFQSAKTNLEKTLGRSLTDEEFLQYAATQPRESSALWISPNVQYSGLYGEDRSTYLVRRPFQLGRNRMKWFDEASFKVVKLNPKYSSNPQSSNVDEVIAPWISEGSRMIDPNPQTELIYGHPMQLVDKVPATRHLNYRTSLYSNPSYKKGGKLNEKD